MMQTPARVSAGLCQPKLYFLSRPRGNSCRLLLNGSLCAAGWFIIQSGFASQWPGRDMSNVAYSPATEIARLADEVIKGGKELDEEHLSRFVKELSKLFSVKADEVAILEVSQNGTILSFLYPPELRKVGSIPL